MDYSDPKLNPFANDQHAQEAVAWLTKIMKEKVNPDFSTDDAWKFYIENKAAIEAEQEAAEAKAKGKTVNG